MNKRILKFFLLKMVRSLMFVAMFCLVVLRILVVAANDI